MALRNDLNNTRLREVETKEICQKHYTAVCHRNVEKHPSQGSCIIYSIDLRRARLVFRHVQCKLYFHAIAHAGHIIFMEQTCPYSVYTVT